MNKKTVMIFGLLLSVTLNSSVVEANTTAGYVDAIGPGYTYQNVTQYVFDNIDISDTEEEETENEEVITPVWNLSESEI